jgi:uncharacterized repeat protein (TIGR03803 family)
MKRFRDRILVLGCALLASFVSGCGGTLMPASPGAPTLGAMVDARSGHFRLLHAFGNASDGSNPAGELTQLNGLLYGGSGGGGSHGYGTIYSLSVTGKERVLHSFSGADGYGSWGTLLSYGGVLYGTGADGPNFAGNVFSITTSGRFTVIHKFSGVDGLNPSGGLVAVGRLMYGTTYQGGARGLGNVYAIDKSGSERSVYSFGNYSGDGAYPVCNLLFWKNKLYGTTAGGGKYNGGTVFSVTTAGKETVLHSFGSGVDGNDPNNSNLTPLGGAFYGTTLEGGTHGEGTVFKLSPSGAVQTLYNIGDNPKDGGYPAAGVVAYRNALYGTTSNLGPGDQGTIFRVAASGKESILYSFTGDDGSNSASRLLLEGTNMYGTMYTGGKYSGPGGVGGTAFRFTP